MSEGEAKEYPKCGGELEKGYAVALGVLGWGDVKPSFERVLERPWLLKVADTDVPCQNGNFSCSAL